MPSQLASDAGLLKSLRSAYLWQTTYSTLKETASCIQGSYFLYPIHKIDELISYDAEHKLSELELPYLKGLNLTAAKYIVNKDKTVYFAPVGDANAGVPSWSEMAVQSYREKQGSNFNPDRESVTIFDAGTVFIDSLGNITNIISTYEPASTIHLILVLNAHKKLQSNVNIFLYYSEPHNCCLTPYRIKTLVSDIIKSSHVSKELFEINLFHASPIDKLFVLRPIVKPLRPLKTTLTLKPALELHPPKVAITESASSAESQAPDTSASSLPCKRSIKLTPPSEIMQSAKRRNN